MTLEELLDEWEAESAYTPDIVGESTRIPRMHIKYFRRLMLMKRAIRQAKEEYSKAEFIQTLYYTGRAEPEVYKRQPFNHTVPKNELPKWLEADARLTAIRKRIDAAEEMREVLEEIVNQCRFRHQHIRNINDTRRFEAGG